MCSKRFLLLLVVFFCLSAVFSWGEVCLPDEEWALMEAEDEELGRLFEEQIEISKTYRMESQTLGRALRVSQSNLGLVRIVLMKSEMDSSELRLTLKEAEQSWRDERRGIIVSWIFSALALSVITFAVGGIVL
jgi:hypothetical protein